MTYWMGAGRRAGSAALVAALALAGCGGDGTVAPDGGVARCVPGASSACVCAGGRPGGQVCSADGTYGLCDCGSDAGAPPDDAATADAPPTGSDVPAAGADVVDAGPAIPDAAGDLGADADDVVPPDVPADLGPADAGAPAEPYADPCAAGAIVDAAARGVTDGATTLVRLNTAFTAATTALAPPTGCAAPVGHPLVVRYVLRTRARLELSTFQNVTSATATRTNFDTVVWALDRCAADGRALGCNDGLLSDSSSSFVTPASRVLLPGVLPAGAVVYVVVAGANGAFGDVNLTVTELPPAALGAVCDADRVRASCAEGASCVIPQRRGAIRRSEEARCVADGAFQGACRAAGVACDPGLACSGDPGDAGSRCLTLIAAGAPCAVTPGTLTATLTSCDGVCAPSVNGARCVSDGAAYGRCLRTGAPCAAGLVCSDPANGRAGRCVRPLPPGSACALGNPLSACSAGEQCVSTATTNGSTGVGLCVPVGSNGGACRAGASPCDGGLACAATGGISRCRPAVAVGGSCDLAGVTGACAPGGTCLATPSGTVCVPDGSDGGHCRVGGTLCAAGLRCNQPYSTASARCLPARAVGASCDPAGALNLCAEGASCLGAGAAARCVADGTDGGSCRLQGPAPCDAGLACNESRRCRAALAPGARCALGADDDGCGGATSCVAVDTGNVCVADGALNGACRNAGASCDAGLVCLTDNQTHLPRCAARAAAGAACDGQRAVCVEGATCAGASTSARACAAYGAPYAGCRAPLDGVAACDAGLTCYDNTCRPPVVGTCGGGPACAAGASCDGSGRCVADGASGGVCRTSGAPCDGGLACGQYQRCVPVVAAGAECTYDERDVRCAVGTACNGSNCVTVGVRDGLCRTEATGLTCNAGLVCTGAYCRTALGLGQSCDLPDTYRFDACAEGSRCTQVGAATPTCTASGYRLTVTTGTTLVDACDGGGGIVMRSSPVGAAVSATQVPIPFAYAWFGGAVDGLHVASRASAAPTLGGLPATYYPVDGRQSEFRLNDGQTSVAVCVKTVGVAPTRRLVIEWLDNTSVVEALLEEGTNAIEFRYGPADPTYSFRGSSTSAGLFQGVTRLVLFPNAIVTPGTSLRFVPQ